jgi:hypothetical protein
MESVGTLLDLLTQTDFLTGLFLGAVAAVAFVVIGREGGIGWGLAVSAATALGIGLTSGLERSLLLGLALLVFGGWWLERAGSSDSAMPSSAQVPGWLVVGLGALVVTGVEGVRIDSMIRVLAPLVVVGAGYLLSRWATSPHRWLLGPLWAATAFGVWVTVPDTELARVLLGSSLGLALTTTPKGRSIRISSAGAFALAGALVWISIGGGAERDASIIGAWGALGVLALLPLLGRRSEGLPTWAVVGSHLAVVAISTRVMGLWGEPMPALLGVLAVLAAGLVGLGVFNGRVSASHEERA